jgi:hypothetical protein
MENRNGLVADVEVLQANGCQWRRAKGPLWQRRKGPRRHWLKAAKMPAG